MALVQLWVAVAHCWQCRMTTWLVTLPLTRRKQGMRTAEEQRRARNRAVVRQMTVIGRLETCGREKE